MCVYLPSGGNQRELARAKNMKKQQEAAKKKGGSESGVALRERKERFVLQNNEVVITFRVFPDIQINTDLTCIVWLKNI